MTFDYYAHVELAPCRYCNSDDVSMSMHWHYGEVSIHCNNCGANMVGIEGDPDNTAPAAAEWARRVEPQTYRNLCLETDRKNFHIGSVDIRETYPCPGCGGWTMGCFMDYNGKNFDVTCEGYDLHCRLYRLMTPDKIEGLTRNECIDLHNEHVAQWWHEANA